MPNHGESDHWRSLASEIGVDVPPEQHPTDQATLEDKSGSSDKGPDAGSTAAARTKRDRTPKPAQPSRPRANWGELAEQLGVVPAETPEAPRQAAPVMPVAKERTPVEAVAPRAAAWQSVPDKPLDWLEREPSEETLEGAAPSGVSHRPSGPDEGKAFERKSRRRRRRRRSREPREGVGTPDVGAGDEASELAVPESSFQGEPEEEPAVETRRAERAPESTRRKRRGRGNRRRSKGGKPPADEASRVVAEAAAEAPLTEEPVLDLDEDEEKPLTEEEHGDESSQRAAGLAHRGIPSWEEAVGVVIAANLEARAKRGGGDASSRPRGGRGRGGRKRGGSQRPRST